MVFSYTTNSLEDYYFLVGVLISLGYDLDFNAMESYHEEYPEDYLITGGDE